MDHPMNRRNFIAASLAASCARGATALAAEAEAPATGPAGGRDLYELRLYHLRRGPMQKRADDYFRDALVPALRRLGTGPVGVFNVVVGPDNPTVYVLIPHASPEGFFTLGRLLEDREYLKAAEPFLQAPPTDPSFVSIENSLLMPFVENMPRVQVPAEAAQNQPRVMELRTYRSHSGPASLRKMQMFATGGEINVFRRVGIRPVFFAAGVTGRDLPSLTYMVTFPDLAAREKAWNTFRADPEWKKLSAIPGQTDAEIVSSISSVLLAPTPYSQI